MEFGASMFDCKKIPDISLEEYLHRVQKLTRFLAERLIVGVGIMARYMEQEQFALNWLNVHRLLLSCLVLAVKLHDDHYYDNKAFQTAGGVNIVMLEKYEF